MALEFDKNKEIILFLLVLLFSIFFISADGFEGLKVYDEGVTVYGASRVLDGYLPYRDFWTVYMPGHYYLYALVFKIFGASLFVERITSILLMVGISVMVFFIARKLLPVLYALLIFFFTAVWLSSFEFYGYIIHPTLFFSLISLHFFLIYLLHARDQALLWAGIFAGVTTLFRHDFGFFVFVAEVLLVTLYQLAAKEYNQSERVTFIWKDILRIVLGISILFVPVALYFLTQVPLHDLYQTLIAFPLKVYPEYRSIPFPAPFITFENFQSQVENANLKIYLKEILNRLYLYFPIIVYIALILQLTTRYLKDQKFFIHKKFWFDATLLIFGIFFYTKVVIRSEPLHAMPSYVIAIMAFFAVLFNMDKAPDKKSHNTIAYVLLYLLAIPALVRPLWSESINLVDDVNKKANLDIVKAKYITWDKRGEEYEKVISYIDSLVPENEKIFVGSVRHDRIFTNDVLFYFLSERESATKYYELHPGVATTHEVQKEIVEEITSSEVNYVVLKEETRIETENTSGKSSGVTLLDDYIRNNFQLDKAFGDYSVWVKKDSSHYVIN